MRVSRSIAQLLPILILAISGLTEAADRDKSDLIVTKDGNSVNGEIRKLERGLLTLKTEYMGTVEIKWGDIDRIKSKYLFTVEDINGRLYVGSLQPAAEPRRVDIVGPRPGTSLDHVSIVVIREFQGAIWSRFSGSAEIGFNFTKASDSTQLNLSTDLGYNAEYIEASISYDSNINYSKGDKVADRNVLTLYGSRKVSAKWLVMAQGKFEHNQELQLDRREAVLAGPGYDVFQTNYAQIMLAGGMSYTHERYLDETIVDNAEGAAGFRADFFKLYSPKVDSTTVFFVLPNITTSGRVRMEFNSKLRVEVFKNFYINLTFYDSFDSDPPSATASKNDYGFVTGLSFTFRR